MANSDLLGKKIQLPEELIKVLTQALKLYGDNEELDGVKRAKFLIKHKELTYEQLKRIKNYFDHLSPDAMTHPTFFLNGGNTMRKWVESILVQMRQDVKLRKKALRDAGMSNAYKDMDDTLQNLRGYKFRKDNLTRTDTIKPNDVNSIMNEEITKIKRIYSYNPNKK